ncbi:MAG: Tll0287-like domain-containing protein [Planctomycetota bacterium]
MKRLLPLLLIAACAQDPAPSQEDATKIAFEASGALMKELVTELTNTIRERDTHEALDVCASVAQEITNRIAKEKGVSMRRTALRYRNPINAPDDYERAWMEKVVASKQVPTNPHVEVVDGELRYLRPIAVAQLCTECHGVAENLDPRVKEALARRYPEDNATGFVPGDFRGVISVRVPLR